MRLYAGTSQQFIQDNVQNQIAEKLKQAFFEYFRYNPSPAEVASLRNSLRSLSQVFQYANLMDHGIILEYQLPLTSLRLDCLICGKDINDERNAVIIELKQWETCEPSNADNEVTTWVGGAKRDILHPAVQVGRYHQYLQDTHTAFNGGADAISLNACTYLHNYKFHDDDVILDQKFSVWVEQYPVFSADDVDKLRDFLLKKLQNGKGNEFRKIIEDGKYSPNKKLMDHVANVIKGKSEYILLDEQQIVFDTVLSCAKRNFHILEKTVIIVKGGPGTGKSVVAINLMAELLAKGYNSHYATGSRAFTQTLRKIIGTRGSVQFKYFNSYTTVEKN